MQAASESRDPLDGALQLVRLSAASFCRSELSGRWALDFPARPGSLVFHLISAGSCVLELAGERCVSLGSGDLAFVPAGDGHRLASAAGVPTTPLEDLETDLSSARHATMRYAGRGARSEIVCGGLRYEHPAARHLVSALPPLITIRAEESPLADWMRGTVALMADETRNGSTLGGHAVVTRLGDVLLIQAIRAWIQRQPSTRTGWVGALRDPQVSRAISAIHRDPARRWTVASLAQEAAMSRSVFSERFTELVGEPAMRYVARWRMHIALTCLVEESAGMGELAGRLGYRSEAAFSRAFKRFVGVNPRDARRDVSKSPSA